MSSGFESSKCNIQGDDSEDYDDLMSFRSSSGLMPSGSAIDANYNSFKNLAAFDSQASQIRKQLEERQESALQSAKKTATNANEHQVIYLRPVLPQARRISSRKIATAAINPSTTYGVTKKGKAHKETAQLMSQVKPKSSKIGITMQTEDENVLES